MSTKITKGELKSFIREALHEELNSNKVSTRINESDDVKAAKAANAGAKHRTVMLDGLYRMFSGTQKECEAWISIQSVDKKRFKIV